MKNLAQVGGMALVEVSAGVGLLGEEKRDAAAVALWLVVGMTFHVVVLQEMLVASVKLVGGARGVVQELGVWLVYL